MLTKLVTWNKAISTLLVSTIWEVEIGALTGNVQHPKVHYRKFKMKDTKPIIT